MVDRETLRELRSLFCALVPDSQTLQMLAEDAGISTVNIVLDGSLESKCSAILKEANRQGAEVLLSLVDEMVERNPTRSELRAVWRRLCAQTGQPSLESSTLTDDGFMETPCRWARYRLRRVIGKGGMGVVYRARVEADSDFDMETTQGGQEPIGFPAVWVALKLLHHTRIARRHHRRSFIDEMYTLAQLSHPNIVRLNRVGTGPSSRGDIPYLEMELIEGGSLAQYLEREAQDEAQLTKPLQAVRFIRKIAAALAYLHDEHHILHLDLKPSNVLLHHDEPKLVDFGLALPQRSAEGNAIPARGVTLGFSSPEQIEGRPVGPASDLFSLGALLWSMLSRDWPPRERRHLSHRTAWLTRQDLEASERFAQLDAPLQALLLDLTREEPHERPSSAAKVVTRCDVVSEALYIAPYQAEFQRERKALTALLQSEKATREELRNRIETRLTELEEKYSRKIGKGSVRSTLEQLRYELDQQEPTPVPPQEPQDEHPVEPISPARLWLEALIDGLSSKRGMWLLSSYSLVVTVALVALLWARGCAGEPHATPVPSPPPSPAPSPTPSPVPSPVPSPTLEPEPPCVRQTFKLRSTSKLFVTVDGREVPLRADGSLCLKPGVYALRLMDPGRGIDRILINRVTVSDPPRNPYPVE